MPEPLYTKMDGLYKIERYSDLEEEGIRATRLIKNVNGFDVPMEPGEEAELRAFHAAEQEKIAERQEIETADALVTQAKELLAQSADDVAQVLEKGGKVSPAFVDYRQTLRDIIETRTGEIPEAPAAK